MVFTCLFSWWLCAFQRLWPVHLILADGVTLSHEEGKRQHCEWLNFRPLATMIKLILSNLKKKALHFLGLLHLYHFMFWDNWETSVKHNPCLWVRGTVKCCHNLRFKFWDLYWVPASREALFMQGGKGLLQRDWCASCLEQVAWLSSFLIESYFNILGFKIVKINSWTNQLVLIGNVYIDMVN